VVTSTQFFQTPLRALGITAETIPHGPRSSLDAARADPVGAGAAPGAVVTRPVTRKQGGYLPGCLSAARPALSEHQS
ncbi:MAG: hypothetical protein VYE68_16930, partial [Acidobacteriota bacterium]|nr:hypothetical protein [Acidobacteriota bacterium]